MFSKFLKRRKQSRLIQKSIYFDSTYYQNNNSDLEYVNNLLDHYLEYGWKENRNPSAYFNTSFYLNTYSDVKRSGVNPLYHYLAHGVYEGRNPVPTISFNDIERDSIDESDMLRPGDAHYKAYIGPPKQYDFMGATQFRLLTTLGLRENHSLLDVGCGSLRAGRFFISYLQSGNYYGIEPNHWLIKDAVENQIGVDQIRIKQPKFDFNTDFNVGIFGEKFDFVVAQSIFSHTGLDLLSKALSNFKTVIKEDGIIAVTFIHGQNDSKDKGWIYPECVSYTKTTLTEKLENLGFSYLEIPWYHPRQTWYLLALNDSRLPLKSELYHLTGAVFNNKVFSLSLEKNALL